MVGEKRCLVVFQPQAWVNDYAVDIDPQGGWQIDVTDRVREMGQKAALLIDDCSPESDELVHGLHDHQGPFSVWCREQIDLFFNEGAEV